MDNIKDLIKTQKDFNPSLFKEGFDKAFENFEIKSKFLKEAIDNDGRYYFEAQNKHFYLYR